MSERLSVRGFVDGAGKKGRSNDGRFHPMLGSILKIFLITSYG